MKLTAIAAGLVAAAARGQEDVPTLAIVAVVGVLAAVFVVRAKLFPYAVCGTCGGNGHRPGSTSAAYGICRRCGGTGEVERFASRLLNNRRDS